MHKNYSHKLRIVGALALVALAQAPQVAFAMDPLASLLARKLGSCPSCQDPVYSNEHLICEGCQQAIHPGCHTGHGYCVECTDPATLQCTVNPIQPHAQPAPAPAVPALAPAPVPAPPAAPAIVNPHCPGCDGVVWQNDPYIECRQCGQATHMGGDCSSVNEMLCRPCFLQGAMDIARQLAMAAGMGPQFGHMMAMDGGIPQLAFAPMMAMGGGGMAPPAAFGFHGHHGDGGDGPVAENELPQCGLCGTPVYQEERAECSDPACRAVIHRGHWADGQTHCAQCSPTMSTAPRCATCNEQIPYEQRQACPQCQHLAHAECLQGGICGKCQQAAQAACWWQRIPENQVCKEYACLVCLEGINVDIKPGQTTCCGNKLCHGCYIKIKKEGGNKCPVCRRQH